MAEWLKAAVLKTAFPPGNGGSNPSPSATLVTRKQSVFAWGIDYFGG